MKKVLTIGGATQDIFIHPEKLAMAPVRCDNGEKPCIVLPEGTKIEIKSIDYSTGGGATNSAVSFKRLGFDVATIIKLGHDMPAQAIEKALLDEGIITDHIIHAPEGSTGISFVIPTPSGDRTVLAFRGINAQLEKTEIPFEIFKQFDQIYITSLSGESSKLLIPITQEAKKQGIPVATNPGSSQLAAGADILREALPNIEILILNTEEAALLMHSLLPTANYQEKTAFIKNFSREVLKRGPSIVAITDGSHGVYVATENTLFFHPSLPVTIVNTLGAGDAFGSCFVASIMRKDSIQQALIKGIINASSVISHLGAKKGLLTRDNLEKRAKTVDPLSIQQSPL